MVCRPRAVGHRDAAITALRPPCRDDLCRCWPDRARPSSRDSGGLVAHLEKRAHDSVPFGCGNGFQLPCTVAAVRYPQTPVQPGTGVSAGAIFQASLAHFAGFIRDMGFVVCGKLRPGLPDFQIGECPVLLREVSTFSISFSMPRQGFACDIAQAGPRHALARFGVRGVVPTCNRVLRAMGRHHKHSVKLTGVVRTRSGVSFDRRYGHIPAAAASPTLDRHWPGVFTVQRPWRSGMAFQRRGGASNLERYAAC